MSLATLEKLKNEGFYVDSLKLQHMLADDYDENMDLKKLKSILLDVRPFMDLKWRVTIRGRALEHVCCSSFVITSSNVHGRWKEVKGRREDALGC